MEIGIATFRVDEKIQCDFYHQRENDRAGWFILLAESSNCVGKRYFQFARNIERTELSLGEEALHDMSRNLSTGAKRLIKARAQYIYERTESVS